MSLTQKGHSQLLEKFPSFFLASPLILHTGFPLWKLLGFTLELYLLVAQILHVFLSNLNSVSIFIDQVQIDR